MALPQDETTTEQPSIDYEALGLEPVSDEELFGFGLQVEAPEVPRADTPEIDYEALGLEPVGDKELFGFEMPKEEPQPSESFLRPVADPFLNIGAGINDVVKGFTDAFGADNPVSQNLAKNSEWYRSLLSAGAKQDQEEIGRIMQEAEGQGVLAEIGAGLKALSVAPVDLVAQGIGSLIPFIATAGVGKAVGLSKGGIAILQGVQGGVVGGGIVKGEIYEAVKEQLINSGVDEAKAEKAAQEAQAYNGKNLDQIFLGVGLGVAASTTGADSAIRSLISRKVGKEAAEQVSEQAIQEVLRTGFVRGAVKDGIVEAATEGLQGGQERLAANVAVGREGFDVEPMRGVFSQATLEGAIGGVLGGGAGGISAKVEQMDARQKVALRDAQKAAEEAKQSNAPASAAAVEEQINQTIEETPDEKVARLQREAQEAAGEIELEEEAPVSGLPPERIKSARWFESAARNRLKELQDKDDAGVEDFTTQERDEFEFLKTSPTPEQIAERYGYGVAPTVEPTAVTTTTPAVTEPAPPTLTPPPAVTEPIVDLAAQKAELDAEAKRLGADNISSFNSMYVTRDNLTDEQRGLLNRFAEYNKQVQDASWREAAKLDDSDFARWEKSKLITKAVGEQDLTDLGKLHLALKERGDTEKAESVLKNISGSKRNENETIESWREGTGETLTQEEIDKINRDNQEWNDSVDSVLEVVGRISPPTTPTPTTPTVSAPAETITQAFAQMGEGAVDSYYQAVLQSLQESGEVPTPERRSNVGQAWERVRGQMTPEEFVVQLRQNAEDPSKIQAPTAVEPTPVTPPVTPQLEPLRRVARAEQTEEDVAGLVGQGLVELYNGQPVITQAGLEALPEAERPRLTPEARKIQIDTRTSEAAAEAISKNLRIGVDQVPVDVRMPAGWTLEGDIYVPPQPQAVTKPEAPIAPTPTVKFQEGNTITRGGKQYIITSISERRDEPSVLFVRSLKNGKPFGRTFFYRSNDPKIQTAPTPEVREDVRYNPLGYDITTVVEDIKAGRTDGPLRAVNNVVKEASAFRDRVKAESLRRQQPRARGKAAILERIARERSSGKLSEETAQALSDFVNSIRNEAIGDTAISIRGAGGASNFDFGQSLVSFFLTQDQPKIGARVGIHEFWHGLARFLPQKEVDQMTKDYTKALGAYLKKNPWFLAFVGRYSLTPEQFEAYKIFNPKEAETKLVPVLDREGNPVKYQIKYDADNYRYIMLDEWIAEKMTDLVRGKQAIPDTFMGKLAKIIRDFMAMIRSKLGRDPYQSFYNLVTDPNQKLDLQRMAGVARPFQIYQPQDYDYSKDISDQIRYAPMGAEGREYRAEGFPTFTEGTPEAATLKEMATSMAKVDAASEAKGGKPETYKISEIASVWMDSGLGERELQDAIVEYTNLTPANAAKVAKAIARQYDIQQSIATAFLETPTGLSVEAIPEGATLPPEVDPDRPKPVMVRLFETYMGVKVPPTKLTVNEKTALRDQIRLKAAANREAKKAQQATQSEVIDIIKAMELRGPVRPKQAAALAKRAAKVIWTSEKSMEAFVNYAEKVVINTNYDADLREAKAAQKRAQQLSKSEKVAAPQREVLADIAKIGVNMLDNPAEFAVAVNHYLRGFKSVVSPDYVVIPDAEITSYLSAMQTEADANKAEFDRATNERLAIKYGIPLNELEKYLNAENIIRDLASYARREVVEGILTEKAQETLAGLKAYDQTQLREEQRKILDEMVKVDPRNLDSEERQRFVRIGNNIIFNNQTNGAEYFVATAKGQQMAREMAKDETAIAKNKAWVNLLPSIVSPKLQRGWALELQSVADTFRNAFGKGAMGKVYRMMGMLDLNMAQTKANTELDQIQEEISAFYNGLEKKYKAAARNQDGILAEGVVGFLIQKVPEKGETESLAQRRNLIQQDIRNRREDPDRVEMANRIEALLQQLDGATVQDILNNLKQNYRPNYDSLMFLKDTLFPKYKEFLKRFDENFNDQANNYENPDYLPIGFVRAGPSLAITEEETGQFYDHVSLRPKQSSYTIKRADYTQLPTDQSTNTPKEIEFNLRRNAFDSLSDQITKAYTNPAWQRINAFLKTPEAESVFGGRANKDFFIERLNRLRLSRMRRGALSRGYIEKTADVVSVIARKLGTGIALGGVYQTFKQAPDQLITTLATTGRRDLLGKNAMDVLAQQLAPKTLRESTKMLNKFSIGRRGDASAGYKYINQMEGAQTRMERYFTESNWDKAKEQGSKIADIWMVALKKSDFVAAAGSWLTYYRADLAKRGIKFEGWEREAELVDTDPARQDAAAYAEQMTDIYQGSSDPTQMATFAQSGKSGWENLWKSMFVPFNSFAVQQRMRLYSDARDALTKTGVDQKTGYLGLSGTIGGMILFHMVKRLFIPTLSGLGVGVLYGVMGVDVEEPDEEKKREDLNKRWRQMQGEILANMLVGGTGQIIEAKTIDAFNYAAYLISVQTENESVLDDNGEVMPFSTYVKERSPFWRYQAFDSAYSLGMLEIGLGQAEKAVTQSKMLMDSEEMENFTPEEQRLLYFAAVSEWLYTMRLNDADFARLVDKARRDMIKAVKDREKELQRIRSGR